MSRPQLSTIAPCPRRRRLATRRATRMIAPAIIGIFTVAMATGCGDGDTTPTTSTSTTHATSATTTQSTSTTPTTPDTDLVTAITGAGWALRIDDPVGDACTQVVADGQEFDSSFCGAERSEVEARGISIAFVGDIDSSGTIVYGLLRGDAASVEFQLRDGGSLMITPTTVAVLEDLAAFATTLDGALAADRVVVSSTDGTVLADISLRVAD